jgi:hypothetical protein
MEVDAGFYGLFYTATSPPLKPNGREPLMDTVTRISMRTLDKVYRRQALVAKSCELLDTISLDELTVDYPVSKENFERLEWVTETEFLTPYRIR